MKLVVSAFPAVGKSTIFKEAGERGLKPAHVHFNDFTKEYEITVPSGDGIPVFDSDSSKFDKEFFPTNYIQHIKSTLDKLDDVIILVSSHKDVREMLRSQGIDYVLAYPQRELKEEYIRRYKERGNAEGFIGMMENSWNDFIDSCEEDPTDTKIVLGEGEFLGQDYLTGDLSQLAGMENMNDDPEWFHKSLKQAIAQSDKDSENKPIDFAARLQRLKERRDPLNIEEEKEVMVDLPILHFPDGSTGSASDQVEIVRYNNEWQAYLAENPDADVSYMPIEIMGGESMGDILHAPNGTTIDMAQPGWHQAYQNACAVVLEEKPDTLITATIVDTNAGPEVTDQQTLPTDNPEPTVLNTPEGTAQATLTAEAPEGGVAAVDAATIAEPGPEVSTTSAERNPAVDPDFVEAVVEEGPGRTDLIEAQFDMENDIKVLDNVITTYNEAGDAAAGMEEFADGSDLLTAAAADINQRYEVNVEPTIAGMEGFLESLKDAIKNIGEKLKGQPNKQHLAVIKKYLFDADKAIKLYGSAAWQDKQEFKNVGKAKFSVPQAMANVSNPDAVKTILNSFITVIDKEHSAYLSNASQRMSAGLKVFNKYKGKPTDAEALKATNEEVKKLLPIKPDIRPKPSRSVLDALINTSVVKGEIPVLRKDDIKHVVDLLLDMNKRLSKMEESTLTLAEKGISWDDIHSSDFWSETNDEISDEIINSAEWENATSSLEELEQVYTKKMFVIAKFLEEWILYSVK